MVKLIFFVTFTTLGQALCVQARTRKNVAIFKISPYKQNGFPFASLDTQCFKATVYQIMEFCMGHKRQKRAKMRRKRVALSDGNLICSKLHHSGLRMLTVDKRKTYRAFTESNLTGRPKIPDMLKIAQRN